MDQNIQQLKFNPKVKAFISLILGFVSIIPILLLFIKSFISDEVIFFSFLSILGILLGVKGLKSNWKIVAILGITFSMVGLLGGIVFFLVWLGFTMGM